MGRRLPRLKQACPPALRLAREAPAGKPPPRRGAPKCASRKRRACAPLSRPKEGRSHDYDANHPHTPRGLTLLVDGDSLAYAQSCSAQYVYGNAELQPDRGTRDDQAQPLRRLLEVARLLADAADHRGGKPALTAHYVRTSDDSNHPPFANISYYARGHWPNDQNLAELGFASHIVGQEYVLGREAPICWGHQHHEHQTAAELIPMLADAAANDILVVSQVDLRGSLSAGLRELRTLADGSTRRVMAAGFTRLPVQFGRWSPDQCVRRPVRHLLPPRFGNGQAKYNWELVCGCDQAG